MSTSIIIVGGGPGGYVAAVRAAQLGARVTLVEQDTLGGACLNWGCVPTKTLLHSARLLRDLADCRQRGIYCRIDGVRLDRMVAHKDAVVRKSVAGVRDLLVHHGVETIYGRATLCDPQRVDIDTGAKGVLQRRADAIVVATGSRPLVPDFIRCDKDRVITTTEALALNFLPERIAIVGGSVSGCEFASFFRYLGSEVTLIEMQDRLVPGEDSEIARRLEAALAIQGITIRLGKPLEGLARQYPSGSVEVTCRGDRPIMVDYCLLAMGRRPNVEDIGLEAAGVTYSSQGIPVDDRMATNVTSIFAIGDVTGQWQLAHVASRQGVVAVERILGRSVSMDYSAVPAFIYTDPEIASVGLTVEQAQAQGLDVIVGKATFKANAMAHGMGAATSGFVKTVIDGVNGRILGIQMMASHATDLVAEAATLVQLKLTVADVKTVIHPHPTLSETVKEAVLAAVGEAVHA